MAAPKWNTTKGSRNQRRMHLFIKRPGFVVCPKCAKPVLPHTVCLNCGFYKGVEVIDVMKKLTKKEKKAKEKEISAKGEKEGAEKKPLSMEGLSKK
jgi:large subunit ribosomal protein L32